MTIYEIVKLYCMGKGDTTMRKCVEVLSGKLEEHLTEEEREEVMKCLYCSTQGCHYDEYFAQRQVAKMYYTDARGVKHAAPYWDVQGVKNVYESVRGQLRGNYNFWDFYVVLNMQKSDSYLLLRNWFPEATEEELTERLATIAVNWLNDEDWPTDTKIWDYFNGK